MKREKVLFSETLKKGFVITFEEAELVARLAEFMLEIERNPNTTAVELLDDLNTKMGPEIAAMVDDLRGCAKIAMTFFAEGVAKAAKEGSGGKLEMGKLAPTEVTRQ